jgi:hypothetical protein
MKILEQKRSRAVFMALESYHLHITEISAAAVGSVRASNEPTKTPSEEAVPGLPVPSSEPN